MATADLKQFLIERLQILLPTTDLTDGSPADTQVIEPILQRLGTDPFTVDIGLFLQQRLNQAFPDLPTQPGDALTDILIATATLLWEPVVRENLLVKQNLSFQDPTTLTLDEAEALGANLYAPRNTGDFAVGVGRLYFAQPQNVTVGPSNYATSTTQLNFDPTDIQSITYQEMVLNVEGTLYYFDVNFIAEAAGDGYNIDPNTLTTVSGIASAVRITNKARFRNGTPDENTVDYVDRIGQELTERSLVTQRGIVSVLTQAFPDITSLNATGFGDPEMERDILQGGGLGQIFAAGFQMQALPDGESAVTTRRITTAEGVDFNALIAATGSAPAGYTLTLHGAFPAGALPAVRDLPVHTIVDGQTLDLEDQVLAYTATNIPWVLRKNELTLSAIPGGILFPNTPTGTVSIPNGQVHIGGATDIYVRGNAFDPATLTLSNVVDAAPLLSGKSLQILSPTTISLADLVLAPGAGSNYSLGDPTNTTLNQAVSRGFSLQILDPPNAGSYRLLSLTEAPGASPQFAVNPALLVSVGNFRWLITSSITVDLDAPKSTKVTGSDLRTVQGVSIVDTAGGTDFVAAGVATLTPFDTLRILTGPAAGDYTVDAVLLPANTRLQLDRALPASSNGAQYTIFTPNPEGGIQTPFVRITSLQILDTANQPTGSTIPFANPIDIESQGFANTGRGIKTEVFDAALGIVTQPLPSGAAVSGLTLTTAWGLSPSTFPVTFTGSNPLSVAAIISQINAACNAATAGAVPRLAVAINNGLNVGFVPVDPSLAVAGTATTLLFGFPDTYRVSDIHSATVHAFSGWASLRPSLDTNFDVAQVQSGLQIGFYGGLANAAPFNVATSDALGTNHAFRPEVGVHLQVGARSIGTARAFFLDPTSFEIDAAAVFTLTGVDGSTLRFFPDPTVNYQRIPSLPSEAKPEDGATGGALAARTFQSVSTDFLAAGIQPGDLLVLDYTLLVGSVVLADPVANLALKTLVLNAGNTTNKTITFLNDSTLIPTTSVSRQGVAAQINQALGQTVCAINAANKLQFDATVDLVVRGSAATSSANSLLGFSVVAGVDNNNQNPNAETYVVALVAPGGNVNELTTNPAGPVFPTGSTATPNQQFTVFRAGLQRTGTTAMAANLGAASLYYADLQLISEGTGDPYNIAAGLSLTAAGYRSDGYYLTTQNPALTFSPSEKAVLHLSPSILEVGVSDNPANATQIAGQNLLVSYDMSTLTQNVNAFVTSDTERVINENPLARHLIPYFVRFDLSYTGGPSSSLVTTELQSLILALTPADTLDVSAVENVVLSQGASSVQNPLSLVAVIHNTDRTVTAERSQDRLNTGRLAAFVPDVINVTQGF